MKKGKEKPKVKQVALGAKELLRKTRIFCFKIFRIFLPQLNESHDTMPCHYNALITIVIAEQYMYMTKQVDQFYFNLCLARLL